MKKILVVDDSTFTRIAVQRLYHKQFDIIFAEDGAKCIDVAIKEKPDLILLDIYMPGMDGIEAFSRIKNLDEIKDIPVIFVTSVAVNEIEEKCLLMGARDYVRKPIHCGILLERIRNVFRYSERSDYEN